MKTRETIVAAILLAVLVFPFGRQVSSQQHTIKFATVAPEGSTWMNIMREYDEAVRDESGGRLRFKIYGGSSQGEDNVVLRKIRLGQLHSAGFTGVGLGEIAPKVRILDAPFLFRNYKEVDHLYETLGKEFKETFEENDYVLLGWAEIGFVYVFTNTPVRTLDDLSGVRMWMWEGDPVAEATFKALNINAIPLSVIDVLTSLQTGLIDGAYTSPLAAIALQWFTRVKYMMGVPIADASGAVVISKKKFDSLPKDLQEILLRNGRKYMRILGKRIEFFLRENVDVGRRSSGGGYIQGSQHQCYPFVCYRCVDLPANRIDRRSIHITVGCYSATVVHACQIYDGGANR